MEKIAGFSVSDASKYQQKTYKNGQIYHEFVAPKNGTRVLIFPKGTASDFEGAKFIERPDGIKFGRVDNNDIFRRLTDGTTRIYKKFSKWQIEQAKIYLENAPKEFSEAIEAIVLRGKF